MSMFRASVVLALVSVPVIAAPLAGYHPVIVAGPLLGQNLEVRCSNPNSLCYTEGKWEWLWGNPNVSKRLWPCLAIALKLKGFDVKTGRSIPQEDVQMRPLGGVDGPGFQAIGHVFGADAVEGPQGSNHLLPQLRARGYKDDESVFQATYDWRLSVADWQVEAFPVLRCKIEKAVRIADGRGVVLTGISFAGPFTHSFLSWVRAQHPDWVSKHVHAFVPVGAPFNGAVMASQAVLGSALSTFNTDAGECPRCDPPRKSKEMPDPATRSVFDEWLEAEKAVGIGLLDTLLSEATSSMPGIYLLSAGIDQSTKPANDREVITVEGETGVKHYRASQIPQLMRDSQNPVGADIMDYSLTVPTSSDPGVPVHCIISHNVQTMSHLSGNLTGRLPQLDVLLDDGDQTVDSSSTEVCTRWPSTVKVYRVPGVKHAACLSIRQVIDVIVAVATNDEDTLRTWKEPEMSELKFDVGDAPLVNTTDLLIAGYHPPAPVSVVV